MQSKNVFHTRPNTAFVFKRFSRKHYAAFNSMHRIIHIATLIIGYSLIYSPFKVFAQTDSLTFSKTIDLEEVEIVGKKGYDPINESPGIISVITQDETESAPSQSITDLLRYTSNIDIKQRGKFGIQADISIRGSSFDHNLILLNGVNISDPQTGHLSLNLPVETDAINRIEVINGPAIRKFGINAFSGAVNFITLPINENLIRVSTSAGSYYSYGSSVTVNMVIGNSQNLFHYNNGTSNGYIKNTDFSKQGFYYHGQYNTGDGQLDLQFGYNNRAFGANGYYTPKYPDQFERNDISLISLGYKTGKNLLFKSKLYWRRHKDRFELFRDGSSWYRLEDSMAISNDTNRTQYAVVPWYSGHNHHINDALGAQFSLSRTYKIGKTTIGGNIRSENIISTNIGYNKGIVVPVRRYQDVYYTKADNRTIFDLHVEQILHINSFYITAGVLLNWNTMLPDEINVLPGFDLRYKITKSIHLNGSYNYTYGLPTFTDLTYEDPSNVGNNELEPYSKNVIEGGIRIMYGTNLTVINTFYEYGEKIIDWVWFVEDKKFKPVNIKAYHSEGIELISTLSLPVNIEFPFVPRKIRMGYIFINMHKEIPGEVAKYYNLRHKFTGMLQQQIMKDLSLYWNIGYFVRNGNYLTYDFTENVYLVNNYKPYWLVDARITYVWKGFSVYLEATNLLNKKYIDIGSIHQPGRWITAGLKYELKGF